MNNLEYKVAGEFRCTIIRGDGSVEDTGWMRNIVVNNGLDMLMNSSIGTPRTHCRVGTGNSTPVATQSALDTQVASATAVTAATSTNEGAPNYSTVHAVQYTFPLGGVVANLAELGIGSASTGNTLFARALIVDGGGSPTTISVTAADQLLVTYRMRMYPPLVDVTGTVSLGGISYSYTGRAANVGATPGSPLSGSTIPNIGSSVEGRGTGASIGPVTGQPSGGSAANGGTVTLSAYTVGDYFRDGTLTISPANNNPTGGIKTLFFSAAPAQVQWQYEFSPIIPKDNTKQLQLVFRTTVARYP